MTGDLVITLDGPAGVGKSTVARRISARLGCPYLESGRLYRAVAWLARKKGVDPEDRPAVKRLVEQISLSLVPAGGEFRILVDGQDVTDELKVPDLDNYTSRISRDPSVRRQLLAVQRAAGYRGGIVAEGRDMGSVVFPDAQYKFFLDAVPLRRAERRYRELKAKGQEISLEKIRQDMEARDERDRQRELAPLRPPEGAIYIDTSDLTLEQVVDKIWGEIRRQHR